MKIATLPKAAFASALLLLTFFSTMSAYAEDDPCKPCTLSEEPVGYYASTAQPQIAKGAAFLSPESTVVLSASHLVGLPVQNMLVRELAGIGSNLTMAKLSAGYFIIARINLSYLTPPILKPTFGLSLSSEDTIQPEYVYELPLLRGPSKNASSAYAVFPGDALKEAKDGIKLKVTLGENQAFFVLPGTSDL